MGQSSIALPTCAACVPNRTPVATRRPSLLSPDGRTRNTVLRALQQSSPGTHIVWLDQVLPMYRKDAFSVDAVIGMVKSTNHRFRVVTIFRRLDPGVSQAKALAAQEAA
jgi:hypothetical protein